jgi:hypothetical protein
MESYSMSAQRTPHRVSRSPNGCNAKPISLALTPPERGEIERLASTQGRSLAAMSRLLVLKGLEHFAQRP